MKRKYIFFIGFLFFLTQLSLAQDAPLTKAGSVLNATPGSISIPVTVSDFENIGAISLELDFDPAVLTFIGSTHNSVFSGMLITNPQSGTIIVGWSDENSSVTLPDASVLFELEFTYVSGSTSINWFDNGSSCQYATGELVVLNDTPTSDFYIDGYVTNHSAPITYAPVITDAASGAIDLPILVDNFEDIGAIALSLEYDPAVLTYNGNTQNAAFGTSMSVGSQSSTGSKQKITIGWNSVTPVTLSNGSILITLHFTYSTSSADINYSELKWLTDGTDCEYGDANSDHLYDLPYEEFYINGLVAGQVAPITYLPVISNAVDGNNVTVPITVTGFQDIAAVAIIFEYDATVLTYAGNNPNSVFTNIDIGNSVTDGTGKVNIGYFGSPVSITDLESLADIEFTYTTGTTALTFVTDGTSCEYGDAIFNSLWDTPYEDYYFDGVVAGQVAPIIKAESTNAVQGSQISVPVRVWDFNDISAFSLTLDYDPGVLTYINVTPNNAIGGVFSDGTNSSGRIQVGWFTGNPATIVDESVLFYMNFTYNGGATTLSWYDNGGSCQIAAGMTDVVLYDQPSEDYYINGLVDAADFIWVGESSIDWNISSNWSDDIVPTSLSVVSIPSTGPTYWPTFTGDFILGDDCNKLILDESSEMTVTGDMTINPGNAFVNTGSGILKVGGDWLNSGVFIPKTGKVVFTSQTGGYIPDGVLPANEIQNYLPTTEPISMTPITGGNPGPTGERAHSDVVIGFTFVYAGIDYTDARISTNGWISLNLSGDDANAYENSRLFFNTNPTTAIAPWWDNLEADVNSAITYLTSGVAPNRVFTVEWNNMLTFSFGATERINFQLKLYETTNEIELCYGTVVSGSNNPDEGASIGIKGLIGGEGDFIEATTGTTNTTVSNLTSNSNWPTVNYKFTPPPDTVTFYELNLDENAILNLETDVNIIGEIQ